MFEFASEGKFVIEGRGEAYMTTSPVTCDRTLEAFIGAINGPIVKIDGNEHEISGVEMFMPGSKLQIGEKISILVKT